MSLRNSKCKALYKSEQKRSTSRNKISFMIVCHRSHSQVAFSSYSIQSKWTIFYLQILHKSQKLTMWIKGAAKWSGSLQWPHHKTLFEHHNKMGPTLILFHSWSLIKNESNERFYLYVFPFSATLLGFLKNHHNRFMTFPLPRFVWAPNEHWTFTDPLSIQVTLVYNTCENYKHRLHIAQ